MQRVEKRRLVEAGVEQVKGSSGDAPFGNGVGMEDPTAANLAA